MWAIQKNDKFFAGQTYIPEHSAVELHWVERGDPSILCYARKDVAHEVAKELSVDAKVVRINA